MKINKETLNKIAHLSRLEFDDKDADQMMKDMNKIIDWVEKLNELNTDQVPPLTTMSFEVNALRDDNLKPHMAKDTALKSAPKKDSDYFRVPKVIE